MWPAGELIQLGINEVSSLSTNLSTLLQGTGAAHVSCKWLFPGLTGLMGLSFQCSVMWWLTGGCNTALTSPAMQPRRKSTRRQQQQSAGRRRSGSRRPSSAAADGTCCSRQHKAGAAAPGELTHNYGRELLARSDVCLVCGSAHGTLMSGHTGRAGGTCTRQYHAGCLLLLNAAGIRSVTLAKSAQQQQRKRGQASRASAPAAAAAANSLCDGLLGLLWHQSQLMDHQLSVAVVAAVAAAREAAARVAAGELVLICPSHGCHGCQLNGKLEVRKVNVCINMKCHD